MMAINSKNPEKKIPLNIQLKRLANSMEKLAIEWALFANECEIEAMRLEYTLRSKSKRVGKLID